MSYIQGDKFVLLGETTYSPGKRLPDDYDRLPNTFDLSLVKDLNIVYTHTIYVKQLFELITGVERDFIVITHNSDLNVDESFKMPQNVVKWYSQNVNVKDDRIESIPIGLENSRWFKEIHKKEKLSKMLLRNKHHKNLVYMNHNVKTNPVKRTEPYRILENKHWVTVERGSNGHGYDEYLNDVYNHKFVICPEGNGMDTHRTWETLYLNSIPIEKRNINNQFYTDLPICFVDSWEDCTDVFLNNEYERIVNQDWNLKKLDFEYWKDKILK